LVRRIRMGPNCRERPAGVQFTGVRFESSLVTHARAARLRPSPAMLSVCLCIALLLLVGTVFSPILSGAFADRNDVSYLSATRGIWSADWDWKEAGRYFEFDRVYRPEG